MKRLQVLVPDDVFEALRQEASRRQVAVADIVRRGIDRQLSSSVNAPFQKPTITTMDLGSHLVPDSEWRLIANDPSDLD